MSLVARHLESNGVPTVVLGCARDIVESAGVARFVFTDFPLGNPCGKPFDVAMQRHIVGMGLDLLESASRPGTTVQTPYIWSEDSSWKQKIFSREQRFMEGETQEQWLKAKEKYRELKRAGKI